MKGKTVPINKEKLKYRKDNNLCPRDGRPNVSGRKLCEKCLKAAAAKTERYRQRKIDASLCTNCGKHAPIGSSRLCQICKDKASEYCHNAHIKRYGFRKTASLCTTCGNQAASGKNVCQPCANRISVVQKRNRDTNVASNLCIQCGGNLCSSTGKRCQICIDKRNEWYQGSTTQEKDKVRRDGHRAAVIEHYGGKCIECDESRPLRLAIDHMNNDGNKHRKKINKCGSGFFKWLVDNDFPEGFQVLCHNCNVEKHLKGVYV